MLMHPDLMLTIANDRHHELIAESERARVLTIARAARRARSGRKEPAVRGRPTGTLTTCEPSVAVPAR